MNGNEPAYPNNRWDEKKGLCISPGMSTRTFIAAKALEGLMSNPDWTDNGITPRTEKAKGCSLVELAREAADGLLAELAKDPQS